MSKVKDNHERLCSYPAPVMAMLLEQGAVDQWPFELTRHGAWLLKHGHDLRKAMEDTRGNQN